MPETIIIHVEMDHIDYVKMQKKLIFPRFSCDVCGSRVIISHIPNLNHHYRQGLYCGNSPLDERS